MNGREPRKSTPEPAPGRNACALLQPLSASAAPCPPRLRREDLERPEAFHQRLVDWLMQQR